MVLRDYIPVTPAAGGGTQTANYAVPERASPTSSRDHVHLGQPGHANLGQPGRLSMSDFADYQRVVMNASCQVL